MTQRMTINGQEVPTGKISLYIDRFDQEPPSFSSISIKSMNTDDDSFGGVALNCLELGNITELSQLQGMTFSFSSDEDSDTEMTESVFWSSGNKTLEIMSLTISFGIPNDEYIPLEIKTNCFDHFGNMDIAVAMAGNAYIES